MRTSSRRMRIECGRASGRATGELMVEFPGRAAELVDRFRRNTDAYHSADYNEAQLRREFLDPFFGCLGWDMTNEAGFADAYKDVIHEDSIRIGSAVKAPDYCFRIGGTRKFFLEAKRPAVGIKSESSPAYQLRRYAWSAKLPLSILSNFGELAIYDCRVKPDQTDAAAKARVFYCTYEQYGEKWGQLHGLLSKEAVLKGAFDKFAAATGRMRGTAGVDDAFLLEIERWREVLAENIALRNGALSDRDLNFAVTRTIDRIVFLRICEDRGIELYGQLQALCNGGGCYGRLCELFRRADEKYNSGLFHFSAEKGRDEPPDELTPNLVIEDKIIRNIVGSLYYPDSPYEFSVLPADILGHVYEQFLGKVIRLTPAHRARVEEKPEVRKAGGVYYTPTYIVDYIVRNTVGCLVDGLTPKEVARVKLLDPACGSGSFLLGAYQFLLDWHINFYQQNEPEKFLRMRSPPIRQVGPTGGGRAEGRPGLALTLAERKRILLNNIHGVDVDPNAVETTRLSLLLKALEGESQETLANQYRLFRERALPDLAGIIKCGNSLIGPDFYEYQQLSLVDDQTRWKINAFDWNAEFRGILNAGGFDAVIGNPPYVRIQTLRDTSPAGADYLVQRYGAAKSGNFDIYVVFIEKGFSLLSKTGRLGFIVPSKFMSTDYGESIRGLLTQRHAVREIVDFRHAMVFSQAATYTCLLFVGNEPVESVRYAVAADASREGLTGAVSRALEPGALGRSPWSVIDPQSQIILSKMMRNSRPLGTVATEISRGSSTGADDIFTLARGRGSMVTRGGRTVNVEASILRRPLYATDFGRYNFRPRGNDRIIFPYVVNANGYELIPEAQLRRRYPRAFQYLLSNKAQLVNRKQYGEWYGYSAPRNLHLHDAADFVVPLLADRGLYSVFPAPQSAFCLMASGGFSITLPRECPEHNGEHRLYILALLNSRLLYWRLKSISNIFRGGWITCTKQYISTLPLRTIDFSSAPDRAAHDRIVRLATAALTLHQQLAGAKIGHEQIQRQIAATDALIDQEVYALYGLTEEEIQAVERAGGGAPD